MLYLNQIYSLFPSSSPEPVPPDQLFSSGQHWGTGQFQGPLLQFVSSVLTLPISSHAALYQTPFGNQTSLFYKPFPQRGPRHDCPDYVLKERGHNLVA